MKPFASALQTIAGYQARSKQLQEQARQLFELRIAVRARDFVLQGRRITGCPADTSGNVPGPMPVYLEPDRVWLHKSRRRGLLVKVGFRRNYVLEKELSVCWNGVDPLKPVCFPLAWLEDPEAGLEKLREFHEARKARIEARAQRAVATKEARIKKLQEEAAELGCSIIASAELIGLQAEIKRLQTGGCARDQHTTQFCAEAAAFARPAVDWEFAGTWKARKGCFRFSVGATDWTLWAHNAAGVYTTVASGKETDEAGKKACYEAWLTARG